MGCESEGQIMREGDNFEWVRGSDSARRNFIMGCESEGQIVREGDDNGVWVTGSDRARRDNGAWVTLQRKSPLFIPFLGIARPQPQFQHSCVSVSVSDLYSPRIGLHISSSRIGRPIVGDKSLTDAWMWKWGLRPRYSFSGNICFEISVFCLCSAEVR